MSCVSMRNIGMIRRHISQPVTELLTHAVITSRLDTCNSLLHGLKTQLKRLQRLQNIATRLVTSFRKCTHITPIIKQLHWLPIEHRIKSWVARSFTVSAAKAWNTLPNNFKARATVGIFKTALKTHLLKLTLSVTCGFSLDMVWTVYI